MPVPNLTSALRGLGRQMRYQHIQKSVQDQTLVEEAPAPKWFTAVRTPTPPRRLILKPEGQRSWIWWTLRTKELLAIDDAVIDRNGANFRVMAIEDWRDSGYLSYDIAQGPSPETTP